MLARSLGSHAGIIPLRLDGILPSFFCGLPARYRAFIIFPMHHWSKFVGRQAGLGMGGHDSRLALVAWC